MFIIEDKKPSMGGMSQPLQPTKASSLNNDWSSMGESKSATTGEEGGSGWSDGDDEWGSLGEAEATCEFWFFWEWCKMLILFIFSASNKTTSDLLDLSSANTKVSGDSFDVSYEIVHLLTFFP